MFEIKKMSTFTAFTILRNILSPWGSNKYYYLGKIFYIQNEK